MTKQASTSASVDGVATLPGKGCAGIGAITIGVRSAVRLQATGIFEPHMLQHRRRHLDMQLLADGLAHPVHSVPAARAGLVVFGYRRSMRSRGRSSAAACALLAWFPRPANSCPQWEPPRHHRFLLSVAARRPVEDTLRFKPAAWRVAMQTLQAQLFLKMHDRCPSPSSTFSAAISAACAAISAFNALSWRCDSS